MSRQQRWHGSDSSRRLCLLLFLRRGQLETTVAEEKQFNPRLSKDIDTFVNIMENLNLAYPKMIGEYR